MQISQLFMFQATHTWFIVAQVMSFGEWLSIIARSELGSDLDCSVINARSELGSDLDCYELKWPEESWVIMVQSALIGRAQKCFNLLPENEGYSELKRLVLREYELRPESYRLNSERIGNCLIQKPMLITYVPLRLKYIWLIKILKDPYEASKTADDYSICHRLTRRTEVSESHFKMGGNTRSQHHKNRDNGADDSSRTKEKGKSFEKRDLSTIQCFKCREMGYYAKSCTSAENRQVHL